MYSVKGEVDLDFYEMPPVPPTGMFDIRYSSGRIAEDLNSAIKTIEMSGVTYPLTVRVEGMDIRLQDETGAQLNVNLKSGEDIVISDATIQKLMVSGEFNYQTNMHWSRITQIHLTKVPKINFTISSVIASEQSNLKWLP